jgi:site-specific recombinase XerD
MKKDAVDLKNRLIKLNGKGDKDRIINIGQFSYDMFNRWLRFRNGNNGKMFTLRDGGGLSSKELRDLVSRVTKRILGKSRTPHEFRHSVATMLMRESGRIDVIKEYLGHATIETTLIYTHLADEDMRRVIGSSQALS